MKHFLWQISLLLLLVIVTLAIGECVARKVPNPYMYKHEWMQQHADKVETLILGSSHAYFGISPCCMKRSLAFNLANVSQNLKYDYFLLEQNANRYQNLEQVILTISYFTLFSQSFEYTDSWWYSINYKIYMECPYYSDYSKYNLEMAHFPVYAGKLKNVFLGKSNITCDTLGWGANYLLRNKAKYTWDKTQAREAVLRHTAKDWSSLSVNMQDLNKIASFCQKKSISLILVTTPTWHAYYNQLDKEQLNKMYECIKVIQDKYKIPYYNFLTDKRFVSDDFYDSDHLSELGACKFTRILENYLLSPL